MRTPNKLLAFFGPALYNRRNILYTAIIRYAEISLTSPLSGQLFSLSYRMFRLLEISFLLKVGSTLPWNTPSLAVSGLGISSTERVRPLRSGLRPSR